MIRDANDLEDDTVLDATFCIVGAGAAGITLALRLMATGRPVLLLESGGERTETDTQALYAGTVADPALHAAPHRYRLRRFGGSTGIWGGRCVPLDPIDFERRPWIAHSGWPFGFDALAPYYAEANRLCEAGRFAYSAGDAFPDGMPPIIRGFVPGQFTDGTLERFSCPTDFGRRYRARLAASRTVDVLLHANVTEIHTNMQGAVAGLTVKTLQGKTMSARATVYVLAMGGLEIPRLLLASRDNHASGVGNAHGWVGRTYMCHIAGTAGAVTPRSQDAVSHGYAISRDGVYCRRRFAVTAAAQRRLQIGNFTAKLHHPRIPDPAHRTGALSALFLAKPLIRYEYRKRLHGEDRARWPLLARHAWNVARDPAGTAGFLMHWARRRIMAERKFPSIIVEPRSGAYSLDFNSEQVPNRDSRVHLTQTRDRLGLQQIGVDWRPSAADLRTVGTAIGALAADLAGSGCASLVHDPAAAAIEALRDGAYGGHHIGTTRMAASPHHGVVDGDGRVHGVPNLFIAGSSIFPTSGQANPTLTIVAMALRLGDRLERVARATVPTAARWTRPPG